jgi:hypothetical protein
MVKKSRKYLSMSYKLRKEFKNIFACLKIQKVLLGFYNQFVKLQRILAYFSNILKTYFWQENILFTFNIRIKKPTKELI